ncbi:MAG: carboxynorspermidine decarboxylase, partial [Oscillospiraceae bacterium]|nr:carboxynorspermidine decarboxylase [Oscillospiraceae bacterium]
EAWALNAGFLASRVLDVTENGSVKNAILDCSAACHMPDVIEMPYMPPLYGAAEGSGDDNSNVYRLGGPSCLSGDVIGDFEFDHALQIGELILFGDLAIYSTCKNNTFNGMPLPNIWYRRADGSLEQLTDFGYRDFKYRLGRAEKK